MVSIPSQHEMGVGDASPPPAGSEQGGNASVAAASGQDAAAALLQELLQLKAKVAELEGRISGAGLAGAAPANAQQQQGASEMLSGSYCAMPVWVVACSLWGSTIAPPRPLPTRVSSPWITRRWLCSRPQNWSGVITLPRHCGSQCHAPLHLSVGPQCFSPKMTHRCLNMNGSGT